MSEKLSKGAEMYSEAQSIEEAGDGIRYLAGDGPLKARVRRAHRYLCNVCTPRRVQAYLYGEPRQTPAHEAKAIKAAVELKRREEIQRLRSQLATIETMRQDNTDALVEDARKLLGPLFDRLVAVGAIKVDGVETPKDGERKRAPEAGH